MRHNAPDEIPIISIRFDFGSSLPEETVLLLEEVFPAGAGEAVFFITTIAFLEFPSPAPEEG